MSDSASDVVKFTIAGQVGGKDAYTVLQPHFKQIDHILKNCLPRIGATGLLHEVAFILRVDGSVSQFGVVGCGEVSYDDGDKSISIDIGIPVEVWQACSRKNLAEFIMKSIMQSLSKMIELKPLRESASLAAEIQRSLDALYQEYVNYRE